MSSIDTSGTLYIRDSGGVQYSTDNTNWIPVSTWPVTITNIDIPNSTLKVLFTTDITLTVSNQYFITGSAYIQFGDTSLQSNGTRPTITVSGVSGYPGLIQNNVNPNISILNLLIDGSTSTLDLYGGWVAHTGFANDVASIDNYIVNCSSIGPIDSSCGGIVGSFSAFNGGKLNIIGCSSTGAIGGGGGGIVGSVCGSDSPNSVLNIEQCFSTGTINITSGGICGSAPGRDNGNTIVTKCYSTGDIIDRGGGIIGSSGGQNGSVTVMSCYSSGEIMNKSGGIFSVSAGDLSGSATATNCYSTGSLNDAGGIFGKDFTSSAIASNCYTSGTGTNGGIYYGSTNDNLYGSSNYSEANNGGSGWSDLNASTALQGVGTTWTSLSPNTPYKLLAFGASPYTLNNINPLNYSLINSYTYPTTIIAGDSTTGVVAAGYTSFQILSGGDPTITIDASGVISTTISTPPGTYTLSIYGVDEYTTTILILTVDAPPPPPTPIPIFVPATIPPCCEPNILSKNPQATSYNSDVIDSKKAGKAIDTSVKDLKESAMSVNAGVISGKRMGNWRPAFTSYSSYMLFLQGKAR